MDAARQAVALVPRRRRRRGVRCEGARPGRVRGRRPVEADHGPTHRCVSDEIAGISGFWADLDLRVGRAHKKALPATIADALSIIPECHAAHHRDRTGNGAHAWWLFKEPYIFDDDEDRKDTASSCPGGTLCCA